MGPIAITGAAPQGANWTTANVGAMDLGEMVYIVQLAGVAVAGLPLLLWCSKGFALWSLSAAIRMAVGLAISNIGIRCHSQKFFLSSGKDPDFASLPFSLREQTRQLFNIYIINALTAGLLAYAGYITALIAAWTRSKKWVTRDVYVNVLATIVSSTQV
ncbi:putative transmembrane protein [Gregarina niphandrodes]|uniref:Transmembrane protein n=1 Tax=Gregarina niphandrodes TaxID=110365 RepID=A0A023BBZ7_GRENI|nr:putative transmembrane protein [Gregarina niphandrodes]EZG81696.1 putative transmembrane protein [Gregarina niphandrodes]|eukprot:XP_011134202.1 putative transmembrane protein [Gregarina niphandrodes]